MASKEELKAQLEELRPKLRDTLENDRARAESTGRPFDSLGWILGKPAQAKYPSGPAYAVSIAMDGTSPARPILWYIETNVCINHLQPLAGAPNIFNCTVRISVKDWAATALGAATFYFMGYQYGTCHVQHLTTFRPI
jgi:hypothetical protein